MHIQGIKRGKLKVAQVGEHEFNDSPVSIGREHKRLTEKGFESLNVREERLRRDEVED